MSEKSPKLRAVLDGIPTYKPGQAGRRRWPGRLQAVLQREPLSAAARCDGERHRSGRVLQPLPGHGLHRPGERAGGALRGAGLASGHRHRLGRRRPAAAPGHLRAGRRGDLRLAVVRGVPDHHADQRGEVGAGAAGLRRGARPGRDGRRDHRADPADLRVQPQQPDRHGGAPGRAGTFPRPGARATSWWSWTRPTASSSATPRCPDGIELYRDRPNVAVLRTFSKAYGLAGLRVGFAVAHEPVAAALRKTAVPFGVSQLAQDAAVASLRAEDELLGRVGSLVVRARPGARGAGRPGLDGTRDRRRTSYGCGWGSAPATSRRPASRLVSSYGRSQARVCVSTVGETEANDSS